MTASPSLNWPTVWQGNTHDVANWILGQYRKIKRIVASGNCPEKYDGFFSPYQWTLLVMQALYSEILGEAEGQPVALESLRARMEKESVFRLFSVNPGSRTAAREKPLRAIVYLSWEAASRLFLVRRTYPSYFDFLSISHVPEGWGASSSMLEKMIREPAVTNGYYSVFVSDQSEESFPYTIRYWEERQRLNYDRILAVPVLEPDAQQGDDTTLIGEYLFFLSSYDGVEPSTPIGRNRQRFFAGLANVTAQIVSLHNEILGHGQSLDQYLWDFHTMQGGRARVARLELARLPSLDQTLGLKELERAERDLLRALAGREFFAVRALRGKSGKPLRQRTGRRSIFVMGSSDFRIYPDKFRRSLMKRVTEVLADHAVKCSVSIGDGSKERFHLQIDKSWAT